MTPAPSILPLSGSNGPAADLLRRRRIGRQPSPADVTALAAADRLPLELVSHFLDQLAELPLAAWLTIGRELSANGSLDVRQRAWTDVATAIVEQDLGMVAWYVRDAIETAVCLASRQSSRWSREERCRFASAHGAAEAAALALLAREHIATGALCALCAPFARQLESEETRR